MKISNKFLYRGVLVFLLVLLALEVLFGFIWKFQWSETLANSLVLPNILAVYFLVNAKNAMKHNNNIFLNGRTKYRYQYRGKLEKYRTVCIIQFSLSVLWLICAMIYFVVSI